MHVFLIKQIHYFSKHYKNDLCYDFPDVPANLSVCIDHICGLQIHFLHRKEGLKISPRSHSHIDIATVDVISQVEILESVGRLSRGQRPSSWHCQPVHLNEARNQFVD